MSDVFAAEVRPETSPFISGARVAMQSGFENDYSERFVEKVHKSGNFTLRGDTSKPPQQWRPSSYRSYGDSPKLIWSARQTGSHRYNRSYLKIWDETTDAEISGAVALTKRGVRLHSIRECLAKLKPAEATDLMLDQIEVALTKQEPASA